jgi:hypothetical protein
MGLARSKYDNPQLPWELIIYLGELTPNIQPVLSRTCKLLYNKFPPTWDIVINSSKMLKKLLKLHGLPIQRLVNFMNMHQGLLLNISRSGERKIQNIYRLGLLNSSEIFELLLIKGECRGSPTGIITFVYFYDTIEDQRHYIRFLIDNAPKSIVRELKYYIRTNDSLITKLNAAARPLDIILFYAISVVTMCELIQVKIIKRKVIRIWLTHVRETLSSWPEIQSIAIIHDDTNPKLETGYKLWKFFILLYETVEILERKLRYSF